MNLTRTLLTAAVALAAVGGASLSAATDASAKPGGWGRHGGHGIHFRHHGHRWGHRHVHFRYGYRYGHGYANPCWKLTPYGMVNVCKVRVIGY
jgi:hypothetical protein